jgi:hypothetical protein
MQFVEIADDAYIDVCRPGFVRCNFILMAGQPAYSGTVSGFLGVALSCSKM